VTEEMLAGIARRQHLAITTRQLHEAGVDRNGIAHRVATGRLTRLHRGVYRLGPADGARTAEAAALLACGRGAHLSHATAAVLWGLPLDAPSQVHVTVPRERVHEGIEVHVSAPKPADRALRDGLRLTSPARTLLDLGAELDAHTLERLVEEAQVLRLVTRRQLDVRDRKGAVALRAALAAHDTPSMTRSEAERRLLRLVRAAGLPHPEANAYVAGKEVDLLWRAERTIAEMDSWEFHSSRASFERDRARDQELIALGYAVIRVTWRQIVREPERIVARLAVTLFRHGLMGRE
jgi:very-short-patch-repair endonuclease